MQFPALDELPVGNGEMGWAEYLTRLGDRFSIFWYRKTLRELAISQQSVHATGVTAHRKYVVHSQSVSGKTDCGCVLSIVVPTKGSWFNPRRREHFCYNTGSSRYTQPIKLLLEVRDHCIRFHGCSYGGELGVQLPLLMSENTLYLASKPFQISRNFCWLSSLTIWDSIRLSNCGFISCLEEY